MIVIREKFNLIPELIRQSELLDADKLSLMGRGDFPGTNSLMRSTMNAKHQSQRLTIDSPEFPFVYNGNENLFGEYSSFYARADKNYKIIKIIKKYNELLKGRTYFALYFLHCTDDNSYTIVERKECENLTENFGFDYRNDLLDNAEVGDKIDKGTVLYNSTSYDENMNVSTGVNGRILYGVHPSVQDDAILISESFAKRLISNRVESKTIAVNENTIFINLYGDDKIYQGLPNIGDMIGSKGESGIIAATRQIKETRMFSDLRDSSLRTINFSSDQIMYGEGEVIDINIYCNNPKLQINKINKQLVQYHNDLKYFYSEIYRTCSGIKNSGSKSIDMEILRWLRIAKEYLDEEAKWELNDSIFSNIMVQILLRKKQPILIGQKIVGRHGNKTIVSQILPDNEMPFIAHETAVDDIGVVHPVGERIPMELVTNPLAIINRTIPMALFEGSITFILSRLREHLATLTNRDEQANLLFDVIRPFNKKHTAELEKIYWNLSDRQQTEFINDCIHNWLGIQKDAFDETTNLRDAIIETYDKYGYFLKPYDLFIPKPKWGKDIFVGKYHLGHQYIMVLKQSGEAGFSVRSAGAISDESLPEKSNENKTGASWHSSTPIRFGEYESPPIKLDEQYIPYDNNILLSYGTRGRISLIAGTS